MNRAERLDALLARAGWGNCRREPLADDASFRRYARLTRGAESAILMDAPPAKEDVAPFVAVGDMLRAAGLSTPRRLAADVGQGFLLLEDFGEGTFTALLSAGEDPTPLYDLAVDALIQMRQAIGAEARSLPAYDAAARVGHLDVFLDWLWPEVMVVMRWPRRMESGRSWSKRSRSPGL